MVFALEIEKSVKKSIVRLTEKNRIRVFRAFAEIQADPYRAGKQLHGQRADQYSCRVGPYRIIYRIEKNRLIVFVIDFGSRGGVY